MLSTEDSNQIEMGNSLIKVSLCEKFLGAKFDYKLTFAYTSKAYVKLKALGTFVPYMGLVKKNDKSIPLLLHKSVIVC